MLLTLSVLALACLVLAGCGSGSASATPTRAYIVQDCPGGETAVPLCATAEAHRTPLGTPTRLNSPTPAPTHSPPVTGTPSPAGRSGIDGQVLVGPTCPVERADSPCPDRPVAIELAVYAASDLSAPVATVTSGSDGHFHVELAPGTYVVQRAPCTLGASCTFPRTTPQTVVVQSGETAQVIVRGDTGIR